MEEREPLLSRLVNVPPRRPSLGKKPIVLWISILLVSYLVLFALFHHSAQRHIESVDREVRHKDASSVLDGSRRSRILLDSDWKFQLGQNHSQSRRDPAPVCQEPQCKTNTSDSDWRSLSIPHDFVVEGVFTPDADMAHGFLPYGFGWYRRHFQLDPAWQGLALWLEFDGTQRDVQIYVNEKLAGQWASGYTSYQIRIDPFVRFDGDNLLAVRVDATQPDSWWYDGGGIYRHVWLSAAHPLHISPWGIYVPSTVVEHSFQRGDGVLTVDAVVHPMVTVEQWDDTGPSQVHVMCVVADGMTALGSSSQNGIVEAQAVTLTLPDIVLTGATAWDLTQPHLYALRCELRVDGALVDDLNVTFGIRSVRFDANKGFFLNEVAMKIKGVANHQDFCGLGVALPDSIQGYRVAKMKEMGANGWRTAHNPPTPALLDECDRQGMLVWDENHRNLDGAAWEADLRALILRDRNRPSVVMWSLCNEVLCQGFNATTAAKLHALVNTYDPLGGRPVTAAMNGGYDGGFRDALDVIGINYHVPNYDQLHADRPSQAVIASETSSDVSDRGIYANDAVLAYVSAYDVNFPEWGNTAEDAWCPILTRDFMSGGFVWTGFDYKGEPTPYSWPNINSHFGIIDICGFPKDNFHYYRSVWLPSEQPVVHALPHWNWNTSQCSGPCRRSEQDDLSVDVWVYSNGDSIELFLNGDSLGKQPMPSPACRHANWTVSYRPGNLTAVAYRSGAVWARHEILTTGDAAGLVLELEYPSTPIAADGVSVALITAKVVDSEKRLVPLGSVSLSFAVTGPAIIAGLGNGDPSSHEHDKPQMPQAGVRAAWNGLARVILQATTEPGQAELTATSPGLGSASLKLDIGAKDQHFLVAHV